VPWSRQHSIGKAGWSSIHSITFRSWASLLTSQPSLKKKWTGLTSLPLEGVPAFLWERGLGLTAWWQWLGILLQPCYRVD
jgi:hypothetical protein